MKEFLYTLVEIISDLFNHAVSRNLSCFSILLLIRAFKIHEGEKDHTTITSDSEKTFLRYCFIFNPLGSYCKMILIVLPNESVTCNCASLE
jgi:hypothetical protein